MKRELRLARLAAKQFARPPRSRFDQVSARLSDLCAGKQNLDIQPLAGHDPWQRQRVGDYRIIFRIGADIVLVGAVVPRQAVERPVKTLPR